MEDLKKLLKNRINDLQKWDDRRTISDFGKGKLAAYKDVFEKLSIARVSKRFWYFDCLDEKGTKMTLQIEAINAENAEIIFNSRYPNYKYTILL